MRALDRLPTFSAPDVFHVVVESPRGSAVKLNPADVSTVAPRRVRDELEHFLIATTVFEGKDLRILGWAGLCGTRSASISLDTERTRR